MAVLTKKNDTRLDDEQNDAVYAITPERIDVGPDSVGQDANSSNSLKTMARNAFNRFNTYRRRRKMSNLEKDFKDMVTRVRTGEGIDLKPTPTQKLEIYALYKQATEGDVSGKEPNAADFVARAKYMAWKKLAGVSKEDAMKRYIDYFK